LGKLRKGDIKIRRYRSYTSSHIPYSIKSNRVSCIDVASASKGNMTVTSYDEQLYYFLDTERQFAYSVFMHLVNVIELDARVITWN